MAFRFKDLIIHVLHAGAAGLCGPATRAEAGALCGPATIDPAAAARAQCGPATIEPAAAGGGCGPATFPIDVQGLCGPATQFINLQGLCGPATQAAALATLATLATLAMPAAGPPAGAATDLATLKRQLQEALARVEAQEKAAQADVLPKTVAETEDLETRLKAALDELAAHKKTLG